ncbi:transmembrane signal receptor [Lithospermum erythrorhizon]|uniref:Transmembrane signal receptor n=1 Tax=Lithospermum erythrorhizon TaxID=34254 RepID=A0AAV3P1N7_LITER
MHLNGIALGKLLWEITELPRDKQPVGCKWVFTIKYQADGTKERYKAHLVVKGFTQTYGIDYTETFAPAAKLNIVRVLLSLAANLDWSLYQLNIKNAFLNGDLDEEVYMTIPPGFDKTNKGEDPQEIERIKSELAKAFEVKDLGQIRYFLGMEVARSKLGITRSDEGELVDKERYQKLVGKLIYLSHTRPDIASAISQRDLLEKALFFMKNEARSVEIYTDADWANSPIDRRSTTGYCSFVSGNLVTWRSKKQNVVSRSNVEVEFRAVAQGMCEALWIKKLLEEIKVMFELPIKQYCDNKAAISISLNSVQHDRTKHVEIDRHFIKEKIENREICLTYVPTHEQHGDILPKGCLCNCLKR